MIQEQVSKNRIVVALDASDQPCASVTSSTHERKSKTAVIVKHGRMYVRHNAFGDDVNAVICLKAMGIESDQECLLMVGGEAAVAAVVAPTVQECAALGVHTQVRMGLWGVMCGEWWLSVVVGVRGAGGAHAGKGW